MGARDIKNKVIRAVVEPNISIPKNPLMILRAIRFSLRYSFRIDSHLEEAMKKNRNVLREQLGSERLQIEVLKMLKEDYDGTLQLMHEFKLDDILTNDDYDIFEVIKDIDIENFEGDISQLIEETV
jgi:tRNA nucleotidyltransferase/poly(A) polymerase